MRYRVIADHSRAAAILIGGESGPATTAAGMCCGDCCAGDPVGEAVGIDTPIVGDLMTTVRDAMGPSYPELVNDFDRIHRIAVAEETAFNRTLASGSRLFEEAARARRRASSTTVLYPEPTLSRCTTPMASRSSSPSGCTEPTPLGRRAELPWA